MMWEKEPRRGVTIVTPGVTGGVCGSFGVQSPKGGDTNIFILAEKKR